MFNYAHSAPVATVRTSGSTRGCVDECSSAIDSRGSDASDECSLEYMFRSDATEDELIFGMEL